MCVLGFSRSDCWIELIKHKPAAHPYTLDRKLVIEEHQIGNFAGLNGSKTVIDA